MKKFRINKYDMNSKLDSLLFNGNVHLIKVGRMYEDYSFFQSSFPLYLKNKYKDKCFVQYFSFKKFSDVLIHKAIVIEKYLEKIIDESYEHVILILDDVFIKESVNGINIENKWNASIYSYIDLIRHFFKKSNYEIFVITPFEVNELNKLKYQLNHRLDEIFYLNDEVDKDVFKEYNLVKKEYIFNNLDVNKIEFIPLLMKTICDNLSVKISDNALLNKMDKFTSLEVIKTLFNIVNHPYIFKRLYQKDLFNNIVQGYYKYYLLDLNLLDYLYKNNKINEVNYFLNLVYLRLIEQGFNPYYLEFSTFKQVNEKTSKVKHNIDFIYKNEENKVAICFDENNPNCYDDLLLLPSYKRIILTFKYQPNYKIINNIYIINILKFLDL